MPADSDQLTAVMSAIEAAGPLTPRCAPGSPKGMGYSNLARKLRVAQGCLHTTVLFTPEAATRLARMKVENPKMKMAASLSRAVLQLDTRDPVALLDAPARRAVQAICQDWPVSPAEAVSLAVRWLRWHLTTSGANTLEFDE